MAKQRVLHDSGSVSVSLVFFSTMHYSTYKKTGLTDGNNTDIYSYFLYQHSRNEQSKDCGLAVQEKAVFIPQNRNEHGAQQRRQQQQQLE
ncbi:hypothetical protein JOB18_049493 [Solea senegalensis]|uniref:Uncharacterized protein n=1 Tax=Solea senegalensis TaxID=28829 RepID=A0AAV6Q038_SOLSE|nr:hypothetical protein JOB18_049493 [Solea senegalensis]